MALMTFALIITYQEKLGNYNAGLITDISTNIITYQEKLRNYNFSKSMKI